MKKIIIASSLIFSTHLMAASLEIHAPSDFYGKAAGISGFSQYQNIANASYSIPDAGGKTQPVATNIAIASSDKSPIYGPFTHPQGSFGWSAQNADNYTFTVFAGGKSYSQSDHHSYCISFIVDGKKEGSKCTDFSTNWNPLIVNNVHFTSNSKLVINISNN